MSNGLIPWKRREWIELRREFDDLFTRFFGEEAKTGITSFSPAIDVTETDKDIVVKAEIPGMNSEDLDVSLTGEVLTIKGEKKEHKQENEAGRHRIERMFGSFTRSFTLPCPVQQDNIQARYENGILTLTMPKIESEQKQSVKIKVE